MQKNKNNFNVVSLVGAIAQERTGFFKKTKRSERKHRNTFSCIIECKEKNDLKRM